MIKLTTHAADMLSERGIAFESVVAVIEQPELRSADPLDPALTRSYGKIPAAGGRVLRVVHRPDDSDILVITAHFDRGKKL
jgi:hypothetical protein